MPDDKNEFSVEYASSDATKTEPDEPSAMEKKEETESGGPKYGLSKPQRRLVRGKIIQDNS